jgi:hypothetical protein
MSIFGFFEKKIGKILKKEFYPFYKTREINAGRRRKA